MQIRDAIGSDISEIESLYKVLFENMADYEPYYMQPAKQDTVFLENVIAGKDNFSMFIAEIDQKAVGFVIVQLQVSPPYNCFVPLKVAYLMDIVVDKRQRGRGIGKALIDRTKVWAKDKGADYVELSVLKKNKPAADLYRREGFSVYNVSMRYKV